jgi:thiol:disulfide interchange protein DsbD
VQPPLAGLAIFAALAVGVAAPLRCSAFSPALARRLPKPGPWMVTLKHALAFPMLAAAAWLVWVLDAQTGSAGLPFILGCALLLAFSAWIYGWPSAAPCRANRHAG